MEGDRELKHMCKFCYKSFPCGRSLGGHMRSHLINISPSDHQNQKIDKKLPKKKLPPLINIAKVDVLSNRQNPNKTSKFSKPIKENVSIPEKLCKQCEKSFPTWKALFGHMKSHSLNGRAGDEDSWNLSKDSQPDEESEIGLCKKKRSERMKRYMASTSSSSLNIVNFSPCVSEIDQHEEEEVALSLIMLSKENFGNSDHKNRVCVEFDKKKNLEIEVDESEVNSPRKLIKKSQFGSDLTKQKSIKRKFIDSFTPVNYKLPSDSENAISFTCTICKRAFSSYQALGGHRASHKKFNGSCAPESENSVDTEILPNQIDIGLLKKNKDHECPICFKIFPSGQALGGHKRSHVIGDQVKTASASVVIQKPEILNFLDLNLPAPVEEECNDFKSWWTGAQPELENKLLLGLL